MERRKEILAQRFDYKCALAANIVVVILLGSSCATDSRIRDDVTKSKADTKNPISPLVRVVVSSALGSDQPGGVVFAAWNDGKVMRSESPDTVTDWVVQGRLNDQQISRLRKMTNSLRHDVDEVHSCGAHQAVHLDAAGRKQVYRHPLIKGHESSSINAFVKYAWQIEISNTIRVPGAEHGRYPNSGIVHTYPKG